MKKDAIEKFRADLLTSQLVLAISEQLKTNDKPMPKSVIYRTAVYRMAKDVLSEDEFNKLVLAFSDIEKL